MSETNYEKIEVWCDKNSDKALLSSLKDASPFLNRIHKIYVLPSNAEIKRSGELAFMRPLVKYDRADFFIFYDKQPILIVELTEHGYTGDNGLQRFARLASAGEEGIPVLYFTPFSRTRIDEVEATDEDTSPRNVSLNLFKGAERIYEIHGVPIVLLNWKTDERGLPLTAGLRSTGEAKLAIFGELLGLIEHLVTKHRDDIGKEGALNKCTKIKSAISAMQDVASRLSLRESEVKFNSTPFREVANIILTPGAMIDFIGSDYFFKGKDHKLIALLALMKSKIIKLEDSSGVMMDNSEAALRSLPKEIRERPSLVYYCGYEKRSEPNGGIIVNLDYLYCRTGKTVRERSQNLVVVWPRVFYDRDSGVAAEIIRDIEGTASGRGINELSRLLERKASMTSTERTKNYIQATASSVGYWKEDDTIGRICRRFCDLLILNDAVLLGDHWKNKPKDTDLSKWFG